MKRVLTIRIVMLLAIAGASPVSTFAQEQGTQPPAQSEDVEPRVIGRPGTTLIGFSGYVDRFFSNEDVFPTNYIAQVDVCRFITKQFAVRGGAVGTGQFGGSEDEADERPAGTGAPALHVSGGVLYYFTPESMISFYVSVEYWAQITQRAEGVTDTGSVLGAAGIHAAISSRASVYIQGGIGGNLSRGHEGELQTRFVAQMGLRIKL